MESKYFIIGGAILIVALIIGFSASSILGKNATGNLASVTQTTQTVNTLGSNGDVQAVKLSVSGSKYILEPSVLKKGVPVRMEVDLNTVVGCARDIVISSFGVRKYVKQGDNIIEFTPDKTGTINIACSMNMYRGTFTVSDDGVTGSTSTQAAQTQPLEPVPKATGACGASGGGCGCGGI